MNANWLESADSSVQEEWLLALNDRLAEYGMVLSAEDVREILVERRVALREAERVELGESIAPRLVEAFYDSDYIDRQNFVAMVIRLQEIFFLYKNEVIDTMSDEELLHVMRMLFDRCCYGDVEMFESTVLEAFARTVRAGYRGYATSEGVMDLVDCWDQGRFEMALEKQCQR